MILYMHILKWVNLNLVGFFRILRTAAFLFLFLLKSVLQALLLIRIQ